MHRKQFPWSLTVQHQVVYPGERVLSDNCLSTLAKQLMTVYWYITYLNQEPVHLPTDKQRISVLI